MPKCSICNLTGKELTRIFFKSDNPKEYKICQCPECKDYFCEFHAIDNNACPKCSKLVLLTNN